MTRQKAWQIPWQKCVSKLCFACQIIDMHRK
nr:MAG TPA: hypothetical protein [Bacteriophage sp.]